MMELMLRYLLVTIFITLTISLSAADFERPSRDYPELVLDNYSWLLDYKVSLLSICVNKTVEKFISKECLEEYVKIKFRNFIGELIVKGKIEGKDFRYNYLSIGLELDVYNGEQDVYYGIVSLRMKANIHRNNRVDIYKIVKPIAGSEKEILYLMKENVGALIAFLSEDYYYISNKIKKH